MMPQIFFEGNKLNRGLQQKRFVSMVVCLFSINWKDYMLPKNTLEASEQIVLKHHTYVHKHTHVLAKTPPQREPVTPLAISSMHLKIMCASLPALLPQDQARLGVGSQGEGSEGQDGHQVLERREGK